MKDILLHLLVLAYGATGVVGVIAYWPTIRDLYHHKKKSANISSYFWWTLCGAIALLYAIFILPDPLFLTVSALHFLACFIVLLLSFGLAQK